MQFADMNLLYPPFQKIGWEFLRQCKQKNLSIAIFETYRSPSRQDKAKADGKSRAEAWLSWHQYGLAFDAVFYNQIARNWYWDGPWEDVAEIGKGLGLIWGGDFKNLADKSHFEYDTKPLNIRQAQEIMKIDGVLGVWSRLNELSK